MTNYAGKDTRFEAIRQLPITVGMVGWTLEVVASLEDCTCRAGEVHLRLALIKTEPQHITTQAQARRFFNGVLGKVSYVGTGANPEHTLPPPGYQGCEVSAYGERLRQQDAIDQAAGIEPPVDRCPECGEDRQQLKKSMTIWNRGYDIIEYVQQEEYYAARHKIRACPACRKWWLSRQDVLEQDQEQERLQAAEGEVKHG